MPEKRNQIDVFNYLLVYGNKNIDWDEDLIIIGREITALVIFIQKAVFSSCSSV